MLIHVFKYILYYLQVARSKPLFFIIPMLVTFAAGTYYVVNTKPNYYSEAFLLLEFQHMPASLISPTVSNDGLQFIDERVFAKDKLISIAEDFNLFPQTRAKLSRTQVATLVRNKIVLRTSTTDRTGDYAGTASVRIGFNDDNAKVAADVTSRLVEMIVAENKRMRTSRATEATKFFKHEVDTITAHLRAREAKWTAYIDANRLVQPSRVPALLTELQAKEEELGTVNQARLVLDEEVKLMEGQLRLGDGESTEVSAIRTQLAALKTEIADKSLVYSATHPRIRLLKQRFDELSAQALNVASNPASAADRTLLPQLELLAERIKNAKPRQEASLALSNQLAARIDWLKVIIARAPAVESNLEAIETEKQGIQRSLTDMQGKLDTAQLGERLEVDSSLSKIDVVEAPEVASQRSGPARKLLLAILAGLSVLVGSVGVYTADSLDKTIRGTFDLADALQGQELIVNQNRTPDVDVRRWFGWWPGRGVIGPSKT